MYWKVSKCPSARNINGSFCAHILQEPSDNLKITYKNSYIKYQFLLIY